MTKASIDFPELNVVVFNSGDKTKKIMIAFDDFIPEDKKSCRFHINKKINDRPTKSVLVDLGYNHPHQEVDVSAGHTSHSYIAYGETYIYPCSIKVSLFDKSSNLLESKVVVLDDKINWNNRRQDVDLKKLEFSYSVEPVLQSNRVKRVTLLVKNNAHQVQLARVREKRLINCDAGVTPMLTVPKGMDGSAIEIDPNSYGAAITFISYGTENKNCVLKMVIDDTFSGGHLIDIQIPFENTGLRVN